MEMERQRQTHSKEIESKDEEVEEIRRSCSKKVGVAHFHSLCINFSYPYSFFPELSISHARLKQHRETDTDVDK